MTEMSEFEQRHLQRLERGIHASLDAMRTLRRSWLHQIADHDPVQKCAGCKRPVAAIADVILVPHDFEAWHQCCHEREQGYGWRDTYPYSGDALVGALESQALAWATERGWRRVGRWITPDGRETDMTLLDVGAECAFDADFGSPGHYLSALEWLAFRSTASDGKEGT